MMQLTKAQMKIASPVYRSLLLIFNLMVAIPASFAVVNGQSMLEADPSYEPLFKSLVPLKFRLAPLPPELCSATFVGNGKILTAAHCLLLNDFPELKPEICFSTNNQEYCLGSGDYEVLMPPLIENGPKAPTRKLKKVIHIPKPDLAIIQASPLFSKILEQNFNVMAPIEELLAENFHNNIQEWRFLTIGQGCTAYTEMGAEISNPGMGVFRIGSLDLVSDQISALDFVSLWTPTNFNSGLCWGDSGGPLVVQNKNTLKFFQIGINSSTKRTYDRETGQTAVVKSSYSRIDHPTVFEWLKSLKPGNITQLYQKSEWR